MFFSILLALSKVLEIEFVYLPVGLPDSNSMDYRGVLEDMSISSWSKHGSSFGVTTDNKFFLQVKSLCENARLIGGVSAIQAAAESFRPFQLESVVELELVGSACSKILQKLGGSLDMNKIYPAPLATGRLFVYFLLGFGFVLSSCSIEVMKVQTQFCF